MNLTLKSIVLLAVIVIVQSLCLGVQSAPLKENIKKGAAAVTKELAEKAADAASKQEPVKEEASGVRSALLHGTTNIALTKGLKVGMSALEKKFPVIAPASPLVEKIAPAIGNHIHRGINKLFAKGDKNKSKDDAAAEAEEKANQKEQDTATKGAKQDEEVAKDATEDKSTAEVKAKTVEDKPGKQVAAKKMEEKNEDKEATKKEAVAEVEDKAAKNGAEKKQGTVERAEKEAKKNDDADLSKKTEKKEVKKKVKPQKGGDKETKDAEEVDEVVDDEEAGGDEPEAGKAKGNKRAADERSPKKEAKSEPKIGGKNRTNG